MSREDDLGPDEPFLIHEPGSGGVELEDEHDGPEREYVEPEPEPECEA